MTAKALRLLIIALAAWMWAAAPARAQASDAARAAWGFDRSDLTPHPDVRFGVLANGMRYALMRNAVPSGALSVRFRLGVGAAHEAPNERGFAHLVEHMIFHGTSAIPEGSLPLMLAHRGLRRTEDFNAFTTYDETVYRIDLARSDAAARETALTVMREIALHLPFTRRAVRGAKQKVAEEIGARDAVADAIETGQNAFWAPATAIARGPVAGTRGQVRRAEAAALRRFYDRYYAPGRATLVLVGDFDPAAAEAEIVAHFSGWQPRAPGAADASKPAVASGRALEARLFVHSEAPTAVTIAVVRPLGSAPDASAPRDAGFLEQLGAQMLNRRLARLAATADAPFLSAETAIYDHFSTARLARIDIAAKDRDWRRALQAGAREMLRAQEQGFTQAEFDEQIAASRAGLGRGGARATPALADSIMDAASRGIVFTAPGNPAGAEAYLARIRLADVNAAFRSVWTEPLIFVSHHRRISGGETAVAQAWGEAVR